MKNTKSSDKDFIHILIYLPMLNVSIIRVRKFIQFHLSSYFHHIDLKQNAINGNRAFKTFPFFVSFNNLYALMKI